MSKLHPGLWKIINKMDKNYLQSKSSGFFLIAGPCAVEGEEITLRTARHLKEICEPLGLPLIFKSSYKKANRTRLDSFTGIGDEKALKILAKVKEELGLPVITDIHTQEEAYLAADYVDLLQIPAFLCRQTELLEAAAKTGKWVNIKKGQFMSPGAMGFAVQKVTESGNDKVMLTERGTTFGYGDLVVDFRGIPEMKEFNVPVIMDCTHSLQKPNQSSGVTGGVPQMIELMVKTSLAAGADGLFIETHPDPSAALSDGANMLPLGHMKGLMRKAVDLSRVVNQL